MSKKTPSTPPFIGTHSRIVASSWATLVDYIMRYSQPSTAQDQLQKLTPHETSPDSPPSPILSRQAIEEVMRGPLCPFFQQHLHAYTQIARIRMHFSIQEDDLLRGKERAELTDEEQLPKTVLKQISLSNLAQLEQQLEKLLMTQETEWKAFYEQCCQKVLQGLSEQTLALSSIEISEFEAWEPVSALLERLATLHIELPEAQKTGKNFSAYLKLKTIIAVHSALSRQHLAHELPLIQKKLSTLKESFKAINQQATHILSAQKEAIQAVVSPLD